MTGRDDQQAGLVVPARKGDFPQPSYIEDVELDKLETLVEPYIQLTKMSSVGPANYQVLGWVGTTAIAYFVCCGGAVGSEPIMSAGGPLVGVIALLLYPLLITVPYAFVVAELFSSFPEDGGFVVWVLSAFGPFWAVQVGCWSWLGGVINTALYPSVFVSILAPHFSVLVSPVVAWAVKAGIVVIMAIPSICGTPCVAKSCLVLLVAVVLSLLVFTCWGVSSSVHFERLGDVRVANISMSDGHVNTHGPQAIQWSALLNTLFWKFDGINTISLLSGVIANPAVVYKRAIGATVALIALTYLSTLPVSAIADSPHWSILKRGHLPDVAVHYGGQLLLGIVMTSLLFSIIGLCIAGTFVRSSQLCGMAQSQLLPKAFAQRGRFDAPHFSVMTTVFVTIALVGVGFDTLLPVTSVLSCACQLLILASAWQLRRKLPSMPRPTKVPGSHVVIAAMCVLSLALLCYIVADALTSVVAASAIGVCLVPGLLFGMRNSRTRRSLATSNVVV